MEIEAYGHLPVFAGIPSAQMRSIAAYLTAERFLKDELIFQQGQRAKFIYILACGEVVIRYKPYDGPPLVISRICPGEVFGWSAALGREIYTSAALATQDSITLRIRGADLHTLCSKSPKTGKLFLERLAGGVNDRFKTTAHSQIMGLLSQGIDQEYTGRLKK